MSLLKRLLLSIVCGIVLTTLGYGLFTLIEGNIVSYILLYPVKIFLVCFLPEPHIMGYDAQGNPIYEGMPIDIFIAYLGIFLWLPFFYSTICFLVLTFINRRKKNALI